MTDLGGYIWHGITMWCIVYGYQEAHRKPSPGRPQGHSAASQVTGTVALAVLILLGMAATVFVWAAISGAEGAIRP